MLLVSNIQSGHTFVPNAFIDKYLPLANGEFIKVYLLLLRLNGTESVSVAGIADMLELTEKDVLRALSYWEKQGLLELSYENGKLARLVILESGRAEKLTGGEAGITTMPVKTGAGADTETKMRAAAKPAAADALPEDFRSMIYVCERYLERSLTRTDMELFNYLYADLRFRAELVEYLVEYCVGAGHKNVAYIRKVAVNWAQAGVKDVTSARAQIKEFADKSKKKAGSSNRFHNFEQREGDLNMILNKGKNNGAK